MLAMRKKRGGRVLVREEVGERNEKYSRECLCLFLALMFRIGTLFKVWALRIAKINYYVFRMYCINN